MIQTGRKGSIRRKPHTGKYRLEEKALFPLSINKSLHITIYVNEQSIRKTFHLKLQWDRGQIKLCAVTLLYFCTKKWLAKLNVFFRCFAYLVLSKSTVKIYSMIRPTHKMLKSTLTFTKCYNQWCNLCK